MLDRELKEQLKEVFAPLENEPGEPLELVVDLSSHPDQIELLQMLEGLAEVSSKIKVNKAVSTPGTASPVPRFHLRRGGRALGVGFKGIPGGHEFSSLVLAILNAFGKGKLPDPSLQARIRALKGPIHLKTYISLTCENCPDVVQALNQMALLHGNFQHEMVDGAYVEADIERLGIQGVPSVVVGEQLLHSGRISVLDLLSKLEAHFGVESARDSRDSINLDLGEFDVAVVGGGPAGASAAIYSARKGLKTALIAEKIGGQVQETRGIENLISIPYTEGPTLAAQLMQHVAAYPVQVLEHRRVKEVRDSGGDSSGQTLELESGETLKAKSLIITTGAKWRELGIPGEKEYLGRGVAFCPHCDGPFYQGKKVAVIGGGNSGVEAAIDLAGIVREVVLIEYNDQLKADQVLVNKLNTLSNVRVVTNAKTLSILGDGLKVNRLRYLDRQENQERELDLDGVFVQIGLLPNSQFLKGVVNLTPFGEIIVDEKGRTSRKGVYAAGDVTTTPYKQIIIAMGEGAKAALAAFEDLKIA